MRIALAQINTSVGDVAGNVDRILRAVEDASAMGAQVVALPELAVPGYPPEDLLLKSSFVDANLEATAQIADASGEALVVFGFVDRDQDGLYNAAAICRRGERLATYRKHLLPNYGVFDEHRHFRAGSGHVLVDTGRGVLGVCICEDAWIERGPVTAQGDAGAQVVVNINASPFHKSKVMERTALLAARARRAKAAIVYANLVGGQDELVFDGGSLVVAPDGGVVARMPQFRESIEVVDVPLGEARHAKHPSVRWIDEPLPDTSGSIVAGSIVAPGAEPLEGAAEIYEALSLALRDYVRKNGFDKVVIGLSGGIDSSLTATIAADALGPERVLGVTMPSGYSSPGSVSDAVALAGNLGIEILEIPIDTVFEDYRTLLSASFVAHPPDLAEENLQARIRGNLLMAISNRYGHLVLATGNKSEMAVGYATLYGDMAGGFALLKDVLKTEVYALARFRNERTPVIPDDVLTKPPSAELRPDQKDSDSLPEYDVLDPILEAYVEADAPIGEIVGGRADRATVEKVITLVDRAEYKRRQAPPGPKVTTKAFGRDRRMPISNGWREAEASLPARSVGPDRT